jgi:hypothetical protein
MTEQRGKYAVLTPGLVIPESLLRAKMESEKQLRNGIFYALSTLNHTYSSELLNGILNPLVASLVYASPRLAACFPSAFSCECINAV